MLAAKHLHRSNTQTSELRKKNKQKNPSEFNRNTLYYSLTDLNLKTRYKQRPTSINASNSKPQRRQMKLAHAAWGERLAKIKAVTLQKKKKKEEKLKCAVAHLNISKVSLAHLL